MDKISVSDEQIDKISKEWSELPSVIKDKYRMLYFNLIDKREISSKGYDLILNLINNQNNKKNNIQYVNYNEGQFRYMDKLYSMNKPNKFIKSLINKAKKNRKLTNQQHYYLMYYLQKGETPYNAKLLPNNI